MLQERLRWSSTWEHSTAETSIFYVTERIRPKQSQTPEGLASCEDVPIARVGI